MKKVLTIGGATQDIFLQYHGADSMLIKKHNFVQNFMIFESGEKIEIESLTYLTGGGATNSAVSFSRLGMQTSCFCAIGKDHAGNAVLAVLKEEVVDTSTIQQTQYQTGISCIINTANNDRTVFTFRGANGHLEQNTIPFNVIAASDQLYITSLSNNSAKLLPNIVSFAHQHNVPVAINPGTSQLTKSMLTLKESLAHINILILNSSEARTFMTALIEVDETYKTALESSINQNPCVLNLADARPYLMEFPLLCQNFYFSMKKFFKEALKMGPSIVVVTNGANGVYAATDNKVYFHPSMKMKVINTVGAGDSFGSCFVASILHGYSIQESLRNGIVNSASVLGFVGAKEGLLTHDQLKEKVKDISPKLLQSFAL